uniref:Uncharacterized protein n=1 Tax=Plectus sambesii TaxID=2011161 RepID=A0A914XM42_9BILA
MIATQSGQKRSYKLYQLIVGVVLAGYAYVHVKYVIEKAFEAEVVGAEPLSVVAFLSALASIGALGAFGRSPSLLLSGIVLLVLCTVLSFADMIKGMAAVYCGSLSCPPAEYKLNSTGCMWSDVGRLFLLQLRFVLQLLVAALAFHLHTHFENQLGQRCLNEVSTKTQPTASVDDYEPISFV